jgi:hypothetical protein
MFNLIMRSVDWDSGRETAPRLASQDADHPWLLAESYGFAVPLPPLLRR